MTVEARSDAPLDAPFREAYRGVEAALVEYGWRGIPADAEPLARGAAVSGFLPGDRAEARLAWLAGLRAEGRALRLLFAERLHAPSIEARRLFVEGGAIGARIHFLAKVAAHPARLLHPEAALEPWAWLREPVLNRLLLAIWVMGPVAEVRVLRARAATVVLLKHEAPARLSILEIVVSDGITERGVPAIADRFECTGSDGFIRVNGIWQEAAEAPRLALHRGAEEIVRRDLRRDFAQVYAAAAAEAPAIARQSREAYALAEAYLRAGAMVEEAGGQASGARAATA